MRAGLVFAAALLPGTAAFALPPMVNPPAVAAIGGDASAASVTIPGTATPRSLAAVAGDMLDAKDCGAAIDGRTNDRPAIDTCLAAMTAGQVLHFPPGGINLDASPVSPNGPVAFDLSGNTYGTSTVPIVNLIDDMPLRTIVGNGFYFGKVNDLPSPAPTVRIDGTYRATSAGNAVGNVSAALQTNCTIPGPASATAYLANYVWCNQVVFNDNHLGSAQNVGFAATYRRQPITDGFGPRGPGWASYYEADDQTGLASNLSGSLVTTESDLFANGDDPGSFGDNGDRIDIHIVAGRYAAQGPAARIGHAITVSSGDFGTATPSYFGRVLDIGAEWDGAAIDTSHGQPLLTRLATAADQGGAGTVLTFASPLAGVATGMTASGVNLPAGDTVVGVSASGAVTLAAPTTADVAANAVITFASNAPALQLGAGQRICLDSGGLACLAWTGTGLTYSTPTGNALTLTDAGGLALQGHVAARGAAPGLSGCGTGPTLSATASDRHGTITPGSGVTSCTLTFASAYATSPDVLLTAWSSLTSPYLISVGTTNMVIGFAQAGRITYLVEQ